jgi:peptidoglycan/LPS O-acetylase OafA/YrhL
MILLFILAYATFDKEKTSTSYLARGLAWMGTLSYGIYAWHAYLLTHVPWLSGHAVLLLVASITVAYLSYRLIELPAFRLKQWQSPV